MDANVNNMERGCFRLVSFVSVIIWKFKSFSVSLCFYLIINRFKFLHLSGHCNFQSGLCGLKHDKNATFHWTVGSGQTPTESTGPSYDHTSLDKDGKRS